MARAFGCCAALDHRCICLVTAQIIPFPAIKRGLTQDERKRLQKADRLIAEGRERLTKQKKEIPVLKRDGEATSPLSMPHFIGKISNWLGAPLMLRMNADKAVL